MCRNSTIPEFLYCSNTYIPAPAWATRIIDFHRSLAILAYPALLGVNQQQLPFGTIEIERVEMNLKVPLMSRKKAKFVHTHLCPELDRLLQMELSGGNRLGEAPTVTDWPSKGSVFASLMKDLKTLGAERPSCVRHSVMNDPHYGWYEEYFCETHQHLLVAGSARPFQQKK